ncbi:AAA family ATPase [Sphingomonas phyllosphaerae]|uniref:AAA family ATPase n=1 Tax=Sphingomonas phyllosphaerae TaxID=257003 RepID=UPI00048AEAD1|nr:AAA family ATPase [Sphingomonas phyllosphaerae]
MRSQLIVDRMLVVQASNVLYDERFHHGVNIIHGSNGSGKSTLADFIFFGLGGDLREWKPYASRAEAVMLQITTPQGVLTTRRYVSSDASRPMDIFFGSMEEALSAGSDLWQCYPYSRPDRGYSFSQILFRAIGLPEAISDGASNLTMHQILRMLYVDQLTPIQRIFRVDSWDTWQTRQAIGELLAGIGGYELYDRQILLRETEKKYKEISTALTNLMAVASGYGEQILVEHIEAGIANADLERTRLLAAIDALSDDDDHDDASQALKAARAEALKAFRTSRRRVVDLTDAIETLGYEIADADAFLEHLRESLRDFDDAALTFSALGRLEFDYCPSCFAVVHEKAADHCQLCDQPHVLGADDSRTLAVRLDLQMQLRESTGLQEERRAELATMTANLRVAKLELRRATTTIEVSRTGPATKREASVAELSRKVGFIDSQLEVLQRRLELGRNIRVLSLQKEGLNADVSRLRSEVEAIGRSQDQRKRSAYTLISNEAKALLDDDLEEHSDFGQIDYIDFSFAEDWIAINKDKNRAGSASGMVVLKNSFAAATLLASIADKRFCLPRWMLFDNVEDKGMVEERSWNFQRLLVSRSKQAENLHQIIFTTSKIAPELESSNLVVGRKYTKAAPSLAIVGQLGSPLP